MADIFTSYASEDRDRIYPLGNFLESTGWSVWWDRRTNACTGFDREIERELDTARAARKKTAAKTTRKKAPAASRVKAKAVPKNRSSVS